MRYLVGLVSVLAGLGTLPQSASAQAGEEGTTSEPNLKEPAPSSEPTPEEPALQLKLDDAGVDVVPSPPRTADGYTLEEMELRERVRADSLSVELRFRIFTNSFRWSSFRPGPIYIPPTGNRSQYGVPGIGVRFYPKGGHGLLVDADYRIDLDLDYIWGAWLRTDFALAHAGYAYRHIIPSRRKPGRRAWALTGHGSIAAGASLASYSNADDYARQRSPVIGARFGFDVDWHISRFFMGWILRYEILSHTKGWLRTSQFISFNVVPIFAIGASIGREVVQSRNANPSVDAAKVNALDEWSAATESD